MPIYAISSVFVLRKANDPHVMGYFTLSASSTVMRWFTPQVVPSHPFRVTIP